MDTMYAGLAALFAMLTLSMPLAAQAVSGLPMFEKHAAVAPERTLLPDPRGEISHAPQ
jgi:hypothetical protein